MGEWGGKGGNGAATGEGGTGPQATELLRVGVRGLWAALGLSWLAG